MKKVLYWLVIKLLLLLELLLICSNAKLNGYNPIEIFLVEIYKFKCAYAFTFAIF